jgi:hypothetical protein
MLPLIFDAMNFCWGKSEKVREGRKKGRKEGLYERKKGRTI